MQRQDHVGPASGLESFTIYQLYFFCQFSSSSLGKLHCSPAIRAGFRSAEHTQRRLVAALRTEHMVGFWRDFEAPP